MLVLLKQYIESDLLNYIISLELIKKVLDE